jgi:hypothetical protein
MAGPAAQSRELAGTLRARRRPARSLRGKESNPGPPGQQLALLLDRERLQCVLERQQGIMNTNMQKDSQTDRQSKGGREWREELRRKAVSTLAENEPKD